jgi:hypothetical protein
MEHDENDRGAILELIATRFGVAPSIRDLQSLDSDRKRSVKIYLGEMIITDGVTDGEINACGREIEGIIDQIGF